MYYCSRSHPHKSTKAASHCRECWWTDKIIKEEKQLCINNCMPVESVYYPLGKGTCFKCKRTNVMIGARINHNARERRKQI